MSEHYVIDMACNHLVVDIVWFVFLEIHRFLRSKSKVLETYGVCMKREEKRIKDRDG